MKILVTGKGGREHALLQALKDSDATVELYCCPGSDAIARVATCVSAGSVAELVDWASREGIDFVMAGEEAYLVEGEGLANLCEQANLPCWGPHKASAQLEASKEFAKEFLNRHHIPTASAWACGSYDDAMSAIQGRYPTVLKFDGLAAGKGVAVCPDEESARDFLEEVFEERRFGAGRLLVEECLIGPEVSIFAAVVDEAYQIFTPARDYKRIFDGDQGPNTGGMGAVASRQLLTSELMAEIEEKIVKPTVVGLNKDGLPYRGFLYFGLMLTSNGPKVIEYNCRFGDPECQAVMPLLSGEFAKFCYYGAQGSLRSDLIHFSDNWSICLVAASAGYPESSSKNDLITGLDSLDGVRVYHAGTKLLENGEFVTNGGRVLAVVAQASERHAARERAYSQLNKIQFEGRQTRSDIGSLHFD